MSQEDYQPDEKSPIEQELVSSMMALSLLEKVYSLIHSTTKRLLDYPGTQFETEVYDLLEAGKIMSQALAWVPFSHPPKGAQIQALRYSVSSN